MMHQSLGRSLIFAFVGLCLVLAACTPAADLTSSPPPGPSPIHSPTSQPLPTATAPVLPQAPDLDSARLTVADLPSGFSVIEPRDSVLQGGWTSGLWTEVLAHIGPGLAAAQLQGFQSFETDSEILASFLVYPLNQTEAEYYDGLVGDPLLLARAVNSDLTPDAAVVAIPGSNALAEASGGVRFPFYNSYAEWPFMDVLVFRRGAVLAFILYQNYSDGASTTLDDNFVDLGQTVDGRLQAALASSPELAAPGTALATAEDPALSRLANLTQSMLGWPAEYLNLEETGSGSGNGLFFALHAFGSRIRSHSLLGTEDTEYVPEVVQLMVIYPLDADEQQTFDWLLADPARLAEYLINNLCWAAATDPPDSYDDLYAPLTGLEGATTGDAVGGLKMGGDVVIVRRGGALTVVSLGYPPDVTPARSALELAQTLDAGVAAALAGDLPAAFSATRTPVPATPTATALPTPSLSYRRLPVDIDDVNAEAISPDGRYLALADSYYDVTLWDTETLALVATVAKDWHSRSLVFSPDGRLLAVAGWDGILLWDVVQHTRVAEIRAAIDIVADDVLFSPNGQLLAFVHDGHVALWDVVTRQMAAAQLADDTGGITSLAFSPDGQRLAAGGSDGLIWLWKLVPIPVALDPLPVEASTLNVLAFSPDGQWLAAGGFSDHLQLWQFTPSPLPLDPLPGQWDTVAFLAFTPDGRRLIAAGFTSTDFSDSDISVWDLTVSPPQRATIDAQELIAYVAVSSDGRLLARRDMGVHLWDLDTAQQAEWMPEAGGPLLFSPDGRNLLTTCDSTSICLWDIAELQ